MVQYDYPQVKSPKTSQVGSDNRLYKDNLREIRDPRDLLQWLPRPDSVDVHHLMFRFALVPILRALVDSLGTQGLHLKLRWLACKDLSRRMAPGPSPLDIVRLLDER